jgi:hypothetical protein
MRSCPSCRREVPSGALVCPWCGRGVAGPGGPPGDGPFGAGALAFSHAGRRFVLGWGPDFFGIWDRARPGHPVATFPRTDEGWVQAWTTFVSWEPEPVEVPRPALRPDTAEARGFLPAGTRARAASALVGLVGLLSAVGAVLQATHLSVLSRFRAGDATRAAVRASEGRLTTLEGLAALALLGAGLAWLLWQHRAHANLRALGARGLRFTPGWAVGWWFVPLANLFMPYLAVRELWRASVAGARHEGRTSGLLVPAWWGTWLGGNLLSVVGVAVGEEDRVATLMARSGWFAASDAAVAVAAALAVAVVWTVEAAQGRWRRAQVAEPARPA